MKNMCILCKKINLQNTCSNCLSIFFQKIPQKKNGLYSLYKYEKCLRQTVVAAKVKNHRGSLLALLSLFLDNPLTEKIAKDADFIMPAPASLWSRCRGRVDVTWFLANSLCEKTQKKKLASPLRLCWRLKKRAMEKRSQKSFSQLSFFEKNSSKPCLLLIDDVVTTGFTLNKVCLELKGMYNIKILTLAYSR